MPAYRELGRASDFGAIVAASRIERLSLSSRLQGDYGLDTQAIRSRSSRQGCAKQPGTERHCHGGDLRRRVQFERTILRNFERSAGYDAFDLSLRRYKPGD